VLEERNRIVLNRGRPFLAALLIAHRLETRHIDQILRTRFCPSKGRSNPKTSSQRGARTPVATVATKKARTDADWRLLAPVITFCGSLALFVAPRR
jgi:hypothetical protein